MPTTVIAPDIIDLNDFGGGWMPDLQEAAVPPNGLIDVLNLLPDRETGTLETRRGVERFAAFADMADFEIRTLIPFNRNSGSTDELGYQNLIAVLRKKPKPDPREADDVQIWVVDVQAETAQRIDHTGRIWRHYAAAHWGETIDNRFYGGSERDPLYSYTPTFASGQVHPEPFEPDASMGQWASTQWAVDTPYSVGDRRWDTVVTENLEGELKEKKFVFICVDSHTSKPWNRPGSETFTEEDGSTSATPTFKGGERKWQMLGRYYPEWADATEYKIGAVRSFYVDPATQADPDLAMKKYPRHFANTNKKSTFICVREHTSSSANQPPSGAWEPFRAPVANVAKYHGSRLFIRDSDAGTSRLHYSALVTAEGTWDATDWDSDDIQGSGFMDIRSGDGDDIRALESLNQYLIIAKRRTTWTLSGYNPSTWTLRQISDKGCLYKRAMCTHEGMVYFFGDQGFFMTDGAIVQEVPNGNVIRDWIHDNVDLEDNNIYKISLDSFRGFLWLSMPAGDEVVRPNITIVYDPITGSFWKTDLATWQFAPNRQGRVDELFYAKVGTPAMVMRYGDRDNDDTGAEVQAFQDIPWYARTGWFTFGMGKEQRRIRRVWTTIRATLKDITLKLFRDFDDTDVAFNVTRTTSDEPVNYVEGQSVRDGDPAAVSLEISGDSAPAGVIGASIQTQFRRKRYNRGVRA